MSETPTPSIHPTISGLSDFSDRLSPVMVKELRQGMRTRAFTSIFLILQIILGFGMFLSFLSDSGNVGMVISKMVFLVFSIAALLLQPMRGTMAVAVELRDQTFELMSLTRLGSVRIVLGKWASLVCQTALMMASVVPYLVMRYFFGGMQLFAELAMLLTIFFLSACLTAVTVGLSCNKAVVVRALVALILLPGGFMTLISLFFERSGLFVLRLFSFESQEANLMLGVFLLLSFYVGYFFLEMGISRIARSAENHAFRKRMVSLVLMGITLAIFLMSDAKPGSLVVMLIFAGCIGLDVCTENAVAVPRVVEPFVKRGPLGRLLGMIFYPGWHTGVLLMSVMFVLTIIVGEMTFPDWSYAYSHSPMLTPQTGLNDEILFVVFGIFYTILAPLLVLRLAKNKITNAFTGYIGILMMSAVITALIAILTEMSRGGESFVLLFAWIPGVWLMFADNASEGELLFMGGLLAVVYLLLIKFVIEEFRNTRVLELKAEELLRERAE